MLQIIITAIITFVITTLWASYSHGKGNRNISISFKALINDLNELSTKLGYKDIQNYWIKTKGQEYADKAKINITNAIKFLNTK